MKRSKMILKDLEYCFSWAYMELKKWEDIETSVKNKNSDYILLYKKYIALKEILNYVDSYNWLKNKEVIEKLKVIRFIKYDYKLAEKELNMTKAALKCFMYRVINQLTDIIGKNTINFIMSEENNVTKFFFSTARVEL